ncbi:MAG TPA: 2-C-methyl-D-erythritol 2,4-cyclodiphosphate synthase [Actinomycetota bacterium]|nr:2-C-methyl-D-erythritol 2,4-cyclodiphosphate synthase [Actinomycetota bacterium]
MTRVGLGFDAHAFDDTRPLVLGGVRIEGVPGLAGHSDADVVSHAVADALLGAAGLGDVGDRFPAIDEWRDADSVEILRACMAAVTEAGWAVANADVTVIAQRPRRADHRAAMVDNLARALGVVSDRVSVKATTTDSMGFTGRGEGIAALAVVLVAATDEGGTPPLG